MYFSAHTDVYGCGNWSYCLLLMAVVTLYYIPNCVHSLIHALCQLLALVLMTIALFRGFGHVADLSFSILWSKQLTLIISKACGHLGCVA